MRRNKGDPELSGCLKLRATTSQRPISPPTSSQPPTQPNTPASSRDHDINDQASQAARKSGTIKTVKGSRETDRMPLTPGEKVRLLKICFKHVRGILDAPTGSKSLEDESYRPVLEEFSTDVRGGFFKTCAEVNIEVKSICRSRRKRTKRGVTPAKRNPEPEHDACIDQWVRVWKCRELKFYLDKAGQLIEENLGAQNFKQVLGSRLVNKKLPNNLSDLILDPPVQQLYQKHITDLVLSVQEDAGDSTDSSTSDESSSDSSDESEDESSDKSSSEDSDEDYHNNGMASLNTSPAPLRSIEKDLDPASPPAWSGKVLQPPLNLQPAQSFDDFLNILDENKENTIQGPNSAKKDGKGDDISFSFLEASDAEEEPLQFSLTPILRFGNNTEGSSRQILPATWENSLYNFEPQPSPMFGIRPLSAIMSTPLRGTPSVVGTTGLFDGIGSSCAESSNKAQPDRNILVDIDKAASYGTPTPTTPQNVDTEGSGGMSQIAASISSKSSQKETSQSLPKPRKRSATPGRRKQFAQKLGGKQKTAATVKASHQVQKPSQFMTSGVDKREVRPSVFYGRPSSANAITAVTDQDIQSLPRGGPSYITSTFALSGSVDTPPRTPRRPFKHYTHSISGDGDSACPRPNEQLLSSPDRGQDAGTNYNDGISDMESLPDIEELGRRVAAEKIDTTVTTQNANYATSPRERKIQKSEDPGSRCQQPDGTLDENRSIGATGNTENNNNSRDDMSSSTSTSRSRSRSRSRRHRSHLSEQPFNTQSPSHQEPSTPKVSYQDDSNSGGSSTTSSRAIGAPSSHRNHKTSSMPADHQKEKRAVVATAKVIEQSSSQGRKRKKSISAYPPPRSSSSSTRSSSPNVANWNNDENLDNSFLFLPAVSSPSLDQNLPRKRQKQQQLPDKTATTASTPADLPFPNRSSSSLTHHAKKHEHEQGQGVQDSTSSSLSLCSSPLATAAVAVSEDLHNNVSSSTSLSLSLDRTRNRTTCHGITPNPHPHRPNNRRYQPQPQPSLPFSTPAKQTRTQLWPSTSSSSLTGGSGASSNLFVSSGSLTPGGRRDNKQRQRQWWRDRVPSGQQQQKNEKGTPHDLHQENGNRNRGRSRSKSKSRNRGASKFNNRSAREMTAMTADFEQLDAERKCNFLRSKNKRLEDKVQAIEQWKRELELKLGNISNPNEQTGTTAV
ncbi:hypothetical protein F4810DRAFT_267056 [Camillea tinctor]|nr:hypothetical protein F4810DRAFT_267056 [Camillea tinctor]